MLILTNNDGKTIKISNNGNVNTYYDKELGCTTYEVGMPIVRCSDSIDAEQLRASIQTIVNTMVYNIMQNIEK